MVERLRLTWRTPVLPSPIGPISPALIGGPKVSPEPAALREKNTPICERISYLFLTDRITAPIGGKKVSSAPIGGGTVSPAPIGGRFCPRAVCILLPATWLSHLSINFFSFAKKLLDRIFILNLALH